MAIQSAAAQSAKIAARAPGASHKPVTVDGPYSKYALAVLFLVGMFNFLDRQIFSILAEDIKADLSLSDGELGFLFGTAFAVFYAIFGIPMGRLADQWHRTRLISISVGAWSLLTALSGLARSIVPLATCRFGVGIGEAGATPAVVSLLYDYFSPRVRATVISIANAGMSIGSGLGVFLGGAILTAWANAWPDPATAPFGLKGWQVAFMLVGLPGLLLAILIWTLREPCRGERGNHPNVNNSRKAADKDANDSKTINPLVILWQEISTLLPIINLLKLRAQGADGKIIRVNVTVGFLIITIATLLADITGDGLHWGALGIGVYCLFSWVQGLVLRDPECFRLIFRCKSMLSLYLYTGFGFFAASAIGFWQIPWYQRYFGASAAEVGAVMGMIIGIAGLLGMIIGGVISDRLSQRFVLGKLYLCGAASSLSIVAAIVMLTASQISLAYSCAFIMSFVGSMAIAPQVAAQMDLMASRTRAVGLSLNTLCVSFLGYSLGPYCVGRLSDHFIAQGIESGESLRMALLLSLVVSGVSLLCLLIAIKHYRSDYESQSQAL